MGERVRRIYLLSVLAASALATVACGPTPDEAQFLCELNPDGEIEGSLFLEPRFESRNVPRAVAVDSTLHLEVYEDSFSGASQPSCQGGVPHHYGSVESSNPGVLAVENASRGRSTFDLVGKSEGEATITITNQDDTTMEREFTVSDVSEVSIQVDYDPYLEHLQRAENQQPPEDLAMLTDARLTVVIERLDADGERLIGDQDVGVQVDGGASILAADRLDYTAQIKAPSDAGSFEITTNIGGARQVDVFSIDDIDRIEVFARYIFSETFGPIADGGALETDLNHPDLVMQVLPMTGADRYVHGTGDGRITVELLEGDDDFILPESDEFGFDGQSTTEVKREALDFNLYVQEGAGGQGRLRLSWMSFDMVFDLVTGEAM